MPHTEVQIETADGRCPTHIYHLDGSGPWPAVIVYMDGIGIRPALMEIASA
jgi:carboxymethylenebutenolidase